MQCQNQNQLVEKNVKGGVPSLGERTTDADIDQQEAV